MLQVEHSGSPCSSAADSDVFNERRHPGMVEETADPENIETTVADKSPHVEGLGGLFGLFDGANDYAFRGTRHTHQEQHAHPNVSSVQHHPPDFERYYDAPYLPPTANRHTRPEKRVHFDYGQYTPHGALRYTPVDPFRHRTPSYERQRTANQDPMQQPQQPSLTFQGVEYIPVGPTPQFNLHNQAGRFVGQHVIPTYTHDDRHGSWHLPYIPPTSTQEPILSQIPTPMFHPVPASAPMFPRGGNHVPGAYPMFPNAGRYPMKPPDWYFRPPPQFPPSPTARSVRLSDLENSEKRGDCSGKDTENIPVGNTATAGETYHQSQGDGNWPEQSKLSPQEQTEAVDYNWETSDVNKDANHQSDTFAAAWGNHENSNTNNATDNQNWAGNNFAQDNSAWQADTKSETNAQSWENSNGNVNNTGTVHHEPQFNNAAALGSVQQFVPESSFTRPLFGPHGQYYTWKPRGVDEPTPDAEEEPRYDVPQTIAQARCSTKQVQPGQGYLYYKKRCSPSYVDTLEEPYARFVFKYRTKEQLHKETGILIDDEPTADTAIRKLQDFDKQALIDMLIRAQNALGGKIPEPMLTPTGANREPPKATPVSLDAPVYPFLKYTIPVGRTYMNDLGSANGANVTNQYPTPVVDAADGNYSGPSAWGNHNSSNANPSYNSDTQPMWGGGNTQIADTPGGNGNGNPKESFTDTGNSSSNAGKNRLPKQDGDQTHPYAKQIETKSLPHDTVSINAPEIDPFANVVLTTNSPVDEVPMRVSERGKNPDQNPASRSQVFEPSRKPSDTMYDRW